MGKLLGCVTWIGSIATYILILGNNERVPAYVCVCVYIYIYIYIYIYTTLAPQIKVNQRDIYQIYPVAMVTGRDIFQIYPVEIYPVVMTTD